MGQLIQAFLDNAVLVGQLKSGAPGDPRWTSAPLPSVPEIASALAEITESGVRQEPPHPVAAIRALGWLCHHRCEQVGSLDHFRYKEEDFPELNALQYGDTETSLDLPVDLEYGVAFVNHWPEIQVARLAEQMERATAETRPAYMRREFGEVRRWLEVARSHGRGLFIFTQQ